MSTEEIVKYVNDVLNDIVYEIEEEFNYDKSSVEYGRFCNDGVVSIKEVYETDNNKYTVIAETEIEIGLIADTNEGPCPDVDCSKAEFIFYVLVDENGKMSYELVRDDQGKIDFDSMFIDRNECE